MFAERILSKQNENRPGHVKDSVSVVKMFVGNLSRHHRGCERKGTFLDEHPALVERRMGWWDAKAGCCGTGFKDSRNRSSKRGKVVYKASEGEWSGKSKPHHTESRGTREREVRISKVNRGRCAGCWSQRDQRELFVFLMRVGCKIGEKLKP